MKMNGWICILSILELPCMAGCNSPHQLWYECDLETRFFSCHKASSCAGVAKLLLLLPQETINTK